MTERNHDSDTTVRPTINDVAREAGVSKSSVSAVLNAKPGVSAATRAHVRDVMARLDYRPAGLMAGRRARRAGRALGLVIKEIDNPYYTEVASGVIAEARARGYSVFVASSEGDYDAEQEAVGILCEQGIAGLIITPTLGSHTDLSHLYELKRRGFPLVLLEDVRGVRASLIDIENVEASRLAVEHLLELGHTRIVHFAGPEYSMHTRERIDGVYRAFSGSPLAFQDDAIVCAGAHLEDGYRAALGYFSGRPPHERATAVTCYNDLVALGLLRALSELGIAVPDDVSVVGFDDLQLLDYLPVSLTSVQVPKHELGRRATELLLGQVDGRGDATPVSEYLGSRLVDRGSTRALARGTVAE